MQTAEIDAKGRKVSPSDEFRAQLSDMLADAQAEAEAQGEDLILKAGFLSQEDEDKDARARMRRIRAEQQARGWVQVSMWLDPTQAALVRTRGTSPKLATALGKIINRLAVAPGAAPDLDDQAEAAGEAAPDVAERHTGSVVELWILRSGDLDGCLRQGFAAGPRLSSLSFGALIGLWHLAQVSTNQDDPAMVEAYLDRRYPEWRGHATPHAQAMAAEAQPYEVLGLAPAASIEEAKAAYRKAVATAHPDKGGSRWLFQAVQDAWTAIKETHEAQEKAAAEEAAEAQRKAKAAAKKAN